jgi:SAM-dependent methyltransferase
MPTRRVYDWMYRVFAPWSKADRYEIRDLVSDGPCAPELLVPDEHSTARAVDLGCGEGGVAIWLARAGFEVVGVDFSTVALGKARATATRAGLTQDRLRFVAGDLTGEAIEDVAGPFDLLVDYSTLDDLPMEARARMARLVTSLARPGSRFFLDAWTGDPDELPWVSFTGPSKMAPGLVPGEVEELFEADWRVERLPRPGNRFIANYLLTKR